MKKKVLQVLGGIGFGGAEAFVMNQFRNMQNEYTFDFAVQVHFDERNSYEREIEELGGKIYYTGLFRSSPFKYVSNIKKIIQEHGPYSAVHIHVNEQCGFAALGARKAGVEHIIVHAHSSQYGQRNALIRNAMLISNKLLVSRNTERIVACSLDAAQMYFGKKGHDNAMVLKNPIDTKRFFHVQDREICRHDLGIKSDLVISHIARFIDVKNHVFILQICEKMKENNIDFTMLLVGDGALRKQIELTAKEKNLSDRVFFLGERSDIPQILSASDVMILPSKYEGLPTVILEAQASGTPCVVSANVNRESDVGIGLVQFREIDGENALSSWVEAIVNHPNKIKDYSQIANAFIGKGISLNNVSDILRSYYH